MGEKKTPLRQCTGCREMKEKKEMLRIIKTPDDVITADMTGRQNGRGAYLCRSLECFLKAKKSKGLERALKCAVPKEVYEELEKELRDLETK